MEKRFNKVGDLALRILQIRKEIAERKAPVVISDTPNFASVAWNKYCKEDFLAGNGYNSMAYFHKCAWTLADNNRFEPWCRGGFITVNESKENTVMNGNFYGTDIHSAYPHALLQAMPYGSMLSTKPEGESYHFMRVRLTKIKWNPKYPKTMSKRIELPDVRTGEQHFNKWGVPCFGKCVEVGDNNCLKNMYYLEEELEALKQFYSFRVEIKEEFWFRKKVYLDKHCEEIYKARKTDADAKKASVCMVGYFKLTPREDNKRCKYIYSPVNAVVTALVRIRAMNKMKEIIDNGGDVMHVCSDSVIYKADKKLHTPINAFGQWDDLFDIGDKMYIAGTYCFKVEYQGKCIKCTHGILVDDMEKENKYELLDNTPIELWSGLSFIRDAVSNNHNLLGMMGRESLYYLQQEYPELFGGVL